MTDAPLPPEDVDGVRLAAPGDEEEIFHLLSLLHTENSYFTMEPGKVRSVIRCATARVPDFTGALGMIGIIERDRRVAGTIGLFIEYGGWHTSDYALAERWNFVHPEFRRTDYAKRLIRFGKRTQQWFETSGNTMPLITGIFSGVRTEAKVRLYRRELPPVGAFFIYGKTVRLPEGAISTTEVPQPAKAPAAPRPGANGKTLNPRSTPSGAARH